MIGPSNVAIALNGFHSQLMSTHCAMPYLFPKSLVVDEDCLLLALTAHELGAVKF